LNVGEEGRSERRLHEDWGGGGKGKVRVPIQQPPSRSPTLRRKGGDKETILKNGEKEGGKGGKALLTDSEEFKIKKGLGSFFIRGGARFFDRAEEEGKGGERGPAGRKSGEGEKKREEGENLYTDCLRSNKGHVRAKGGEKR